MKSSVLRKNILALISPTILYSLLLIFTRKRVNCQFLLGFLKKNIEKQFTLEYIFVNQMRWNLSGNGKLLQK